jgi:hypothetical protein
LRLSLRMNICSSFTTDYKNQTNKERIKEYIAALQLAEVLLFQNLLTCRCSAANNLLGK